MAVLSGALLNRKAARKYKPRPLAHLHLFARSTELPCYARLILVCLFDTVSSFNFCRSELQNMSVNAQVLRLKKQLEDAERKQKESEKVLLHLVTRTKVDTLTRKSATGLLHRGYNPARRNCVSLLD